MNNIKPKYTKVENEYERKFITGYRRPNDKLIVELEGGKEWTLKPTERNFSVTESRMREQSAYQVKEVLPAIKKDETIDVISSIACLSLCALTKAIDLPISEQIQRIIHYVTGALSAIGITASTIDILHIRDILKHQLFFEAKDSINMAVEDSYNMLNGTSRRTRKAISKNNDVNAISLMNIDHISLEDLRTIRDNVETQHDLQFELNDHIKRTKKKRSK